jgi:hypothetical protein
MPLPLKYLSAIAALCVLLPVPPARALDLADDTLANATAYIPPQCYTRTRAANGAVHNSCYACHVASQAPNYVDDANLQSEYAFPQPAQDNHWVNLFKDRSLAVHLMGDEDILSYIRTDNYRRGDTLLLAARLRKPPKGWDVDGNGRWDGYTPDAWFHFDAQGFDRAPDGRYTGWRAYAYYPFLGTFWPTNGSTDDILIRLAGPFRESAEGHFDLAVYRINLAIVEAVIKRADVPLPSTDERRYGVDLDGDGRLGQARRVRYDWAPLEGRYMHYVGRAGTLQRAGRLHLAAGLFPEGTEFLHSVRYVDPTGDGNVRLSARLKELRYARKTRWHSYSDLHEAALGEFKEQNDFPDRPSQFVGNAERGLRNGQGWVYQGFIENARGDLRPQTYAETVFCMGCHSGLGITTDGIFSFQRKLVAPAHQDGWYHWTQTKYLRGLADPLQADGQGFYAAYLRANGAGDEFRANREVGKRFFDASGKLKPAMRERLGRDIALLLYPSRERALTLDKAYRIIVQEQSFVHGRDATVTPPKNVCRHVKTDQSTGIETPLPAPGNLRGTYLSAE